MQEFYNWEEDLPLDKHPDTCPRCDNGIMDYKHQNNSAPIWFDRGYWRIDLRCGECEFETEVIWDDQGLKGFEGRRKDLMDGMKKEANTISRLTTKRLAEALEASGILAPIDD